MEAVLLVAKMLTRGCLQNQMALQTTIVEAVIMVVGFISIFLHISTWGKLIIFPGASSMVPDLGIPVCDSGSAGEDCRASGRIMGFFRGAMAKSKNSWKWFALVLSHTSNNIPPIYFEDCGDL